MIKKSISCVLSLAMLIGIMSTTATATQYKINKRLTTERNISIINNDLHNMSYSYVENGIEYLVIEHANDNLTKIDSQIYRVAESAYVLESEFSTYISMPDNGTLKVLSVSNEDSATYTIPIVQSRNNYTIDSFERTTAVKITIDGDWEVVGDGEGDNRFTVFTVTVVAGIIAGGICGVILSFIPATLPAWITGGAQGAITSLATVIVNNSLEVVYYTYECYYYYPTNSFRPWYEKYHFTYYDNKRMLAHHYLEEVETKPHEINYT